jgi:hypothetical protein
VDEADVVWEGSCRGRFAVGVCLVLVVAGVVLVALGAVLSGLVAVAGGLAELALVEIHVQVARDALRVRFSGPLRWPTVRIPLTDVTHAEVIEVVPWRRGGWGYRGSLRLFRRAAVVLRRGPGLQLRLTGGRSFVVTVDDAGAALAALTALPRP